MTTYASADERTAQSSWYHNIELEPGVWTESPYLHSPPATRAVLKNVDVKGMHVLDIGAMDGLFSILPCRRGAAKVLATDRRDLSQKIAFVKRTLAVNFDYAPKVVLSQIPDVLRKRWGRLPDLTIYSGILYHTLDPNGDLIRIRGLTRSQGIAIIETIAAISDDANLLYNNNFWVYSPGTYYIPTTGWLGSVLPFIGFRPIDCRYFLCGERHGMPLCRIALACRAVDIPMLTTPLPDYATGNMAWYAADAQYDFGQYLDINILGRETSRITYEATSGFQPHSIDGNALTIESFYGKPALEANPDWTHLQLADLY